MDESLRELENELKRLRPRSLPDNLVSRLEHELGPVPAAPRRYATATSLRSWKWAAWSLAGVAAVALGLLAVSLSLPPAAPPMIESVAPVMAEASRPALAANRYEPVHASSVLYDMKDDGVAYLPDQTPGRQVRYRYVDTYTWKNPATKASLKWSVPRDEVRLVKASLD
jgi:hypothetical protein